MADDARISTGLPHHPKAKKLLRKFSEKGALYLIWLILWVTDNRPDGSLKGLSDEDIEIACEWNGEPGAFVAALAEIGWLDGSTGDYRVHDWAEHNPWAANRPNRVAAARLAAKARWDGKNAKRMQGACEAHETPMPSSPRSPLHTPKTNGAASPVLILSAPSRSRKPVKTSLPENFGISEAVRKWAAKRGYSRLEERLEHFVGFARANGKTYADWDQAFQNAIRDDWAKLNGGNGHAAKVSAPKSAKPDWGIPEMGGRTQ